jgi:hypothetical protein
VNGEDGKPTGEKTGPTEEELKIMERLCGRFKHWDPDMDIPKEIHKHRKSWINATKAEDDALNQTIVQVPFEFTNAAGEIETVQVPKGLGTHLDGEVTKGAIHFDLADKDFGGGDENAPPGSPNEVDWYEKILKETSTTNNGGTNVDGEVLREALGVDNEGQFFAGFRKGRTRLQHDHESKEYTEWRKEEPKGDRNSTAYKKWEKDEPAPGGNITGIIIQTDEVTMRVNPDFPPPPSPEGDKPFIEETTSIFEKRYRSTGGKTAALSSLGKWAPDMQKRFTEQRDK